MLVRALGLTENARAAERFSDAGEGVNRAARPVVSYIS